MSKQTDRFRPTSDDSALEETEAHRFSYSDQTVKHDVDDVSWDEDETEGHKLYSGSDRGIKHDVEDVAWEDEDAEGHRFSSSDAGVKHDVEDVSWDDEDGTEGHAARVKV